MIIYRILVDCFKFYVDAFDGLYPQFLYIIGLYFV